MACIAAHYWFRSQFLQPVCIFQDPSRGQLPVGSNPRGEYGKANFIDENGVVHHLSWNGVLDVPDLATL